MLFPLLAKRGQPGPLRFWQTLSNISSCRACGRSGGKGEFVIALGPGVLSTVKFNLPGLCTMQPRHTGTFLQLNTNALCPK